MKPFSSNNIQLSIPTIRSHNSFRVSTGPVTEATYKYQRTQPHLFFTAAHSYSATSAPLSSHFLHFMWQWERRISVSTLSASHLRQTAFSTDLHCSFMGVRQLALVRKDRSYVLRLCCSIQLETDPIEVKEELMPLISPAVTWGRKEDKKKKTRKRLMYNAESALKPLGNNNSLYTPHCSLSSISIFVSMQ